MEPLKRGHRHEGTVEEVVKGIVSFTRPDMGLGALS